MSDKHTRPTDLADLARALDAAGDEPDRLLVAVEAAVTLIDKCMHAGVTVNRGGECSTLASSSEGVSYVNTLQNELRQGPCHPADRDEEVIVSRDLARDERWPQWGTRLQQELGLGSLISLLIFTGRGSYGTLSLYGSGVDAFTADDLATARALAGHLAVSMAANREIDGLSLALASRTVIGQAEGILIERLGVDPDQALAYLKRVSSHTNTKLVDVAMELVRTRELPRAQE